MAANAHGGRGAGGSTEAWLQQWATMQPSSREESELEIHDQNKEWYKDLIGPNTVIHTHKLAS